MAGEKQEAPWPVPKFHFLVKIDGLEMGFQEVSGLDTETDVIEYRAGNSLPFISNKMPGMKKSAYITMKRGMIIKGSNLDNWFAGVKMNLIKRDTLVIQLLDEEGKPLYTWKLANAYPTKITGAVPVLDGNEILVESIELAHEGLIIE